MDQFLVSECYDDDHVLVQSHQDADRRGEGDLTVPGGTGMKGFTEWVNHLPEREPPTYLGLPANAEKMLLLGQGKSMIRNLAKITEILDEKELTLDDVETENKLAP